MGEHVVFVEMSLTGAGAAAVEYAAGTGYDVTVLTRNPDALPPVAARVVGCDTTDEGGLLAVVAGLPTVHGLTTTHDLFVPQAAVAARALGLPGLTAEAAAGVRDKARMRQRLHRAAPDLNPPFELVHTERQALATAERWGYPVVAKPRDANDSWNVLRTDSPDQLAAYMRARAAWSWDAELSPGVLLEAYVDGTEHSVETLQHADGPLQLMAVTNKDLAGTEQGCFAEVGSSLPVGGPDEQQLFEAVSRGLAALGIDCGVIHTEVRRRADRVTILEVNPRLAGDMLGSHAIEVALGASPVAQVVEIALGHDTPWRPTRRGGAANFGICLPATGRFGGIANVAALTADPAVAHFRTTATVGTGYRFPPETNADFVARVITRGDSAEDARAAAVRLAASAEVLVR